MVLDLQKARKKPQQARSATTVAAIFAATLQLLVRDGPGRLTTTRVAERAGVSVGTIYQYFPHKRALLFAILEHHLADLASAVEAVRDQLDGATIGAIADGLSAVFLNARTNDIDAARVIYLIAVDLDMGTLLTDVLLRVKRAVTILLSSASDAHFEDVDAVSHMLCATLSGTTRTAIERPEAWAVDIVRAELPRLCRAYLEAAAVPRR